MEKEYVELNQINTELLKSEFNIKTDKLIITKERIEHINNKHRNDYDLYGQYMNEIIKDPDYVLKDMENIDTVLYLKNIRELNLQMVVKLQTQSQENKCNTVITFWHMRKRSYNQIISKNKKIYEKVDK